MSRRRVDRTRALFERDVVGQHTERIAIVERMREGDAIEHLALHARERCAQADGGEDILQPLSVAAVHVHIPRGDEGQAEACAAG